MRKEDYEEFCAIMLKWGRVFGKELTDPLYYDYWDAVKAYPIEKLRKVSESVVTELTWFPKISELLEQLRKVWTYNPNQIPAPQENVADELTVKASVEFFRIYNGCGLTGEDYKKKFEAFQRAVKNRDREYIISERKIYAEKRKARERSNETD